MQRLWLGLCALLVLGGCSTTRYLTPWLRVTTTERLDILADSGTGRPSFRIEQKKRGDWVEVSPHGEVEVIDAGRRALYRDERGVYILTDAAGNDMTLPCRHFKLPADRSLLDCWTPVEPWLFESKTWQRITLEGTAPAIRSVTLGPPAVPMSLGPYAAGRTPTVVDVGIGRLGGAPCVIYRVESDGQLVELARAPADPGNGCTFADFWREAAGLELSDGYGGP